VNIYVFLKQVPDTETKIKLLNDGSGIDESAVAKWIINRYDEHAIEEALQFKAKNPSAKVFAVCVGPKARIQEALVAAIAMGCDEGIRIDTEGQKLDSLMTAKSLAAALKKNGDPHIIFSGKVAFDGNFSLVSQYASAFLDIPCAIGISKAEYSDSTVEVEREVGGGTKEILTLSIPCVLGCDKGLNKPRYVGLPGLMKAKKKQLIEMTTKELGVEESDRGLEFSHFQLPPDPAPVKMIEGDPATQAKELVRLLREEAKVL